MDKPNILFLTIDALRSDTMRWFGGAGDHTANLDRLAGESIRFTQAITGGSWTQAAFPVILTSSYAGQYGGCMGALSPNRPSPISSLSENGYETIGVSSNPWLSRRRKYDRGFHIFQDLKPYRTRMRIKNIRGGQYLLRSAAFQWFAGKIGRPLLPPNVYVNAAEVNRAILQSLQKVDRPFFLWAHYMDTHWPYHLSADLQSPQEIALAWRDIARFHAESWYGKKTSSDQLARYRLLYERALNHMDRHIGYLFEELEAGAYLDNTIVVVLADHGEEFLDHGQLGHLENNFFEEIVRVPFFIRFPAGIEPGDITRQVRLLDVMPTILNLCGVPAPDNLMGCDLSPFWTGNPEQYRVEHAICERPRPTDRMISVRTEQLKYIWDETAPDAPGLYDLNADPEEKANISSPDDSRQAALHQIVQDHLKLIRASDEETPEMKGDILEDRLRSLGYLR